MCGNWTYTSDFFNSKQYEVNTKETSVFSIKISETQGVDRAFISNAFSLRNLAHWDLQMLLEVFSSLLDRNRAGTLRTVQLVNHELDDWRIGIGVPAGVEFCLVYTAGGAALGPTQPRLHSVKSGCWAYPAYSTQCPGRLLGLSCLVYTVSRVAVGLILPSLHSVQGGCWAYPSCSTQCPERLLGLSCLLYAVSRAAVGPILPALHSVQSGCWTYRTHSTKHPGQLWTHPTWSTHCPEWLLKYPTS
jgi:hypothetical protein